MMGVYSNAKKRILAALTVIAVLCLGAFSASVGIHSARAGDSYDTVLEEDFSDRNLDTAEWYMSGGFNGVTFNSGLTPVYVVKSPAGGSSLTSKIPVSGENLRIQMDISELDYGDSNMTASPGWMGFAYNMKTVSERVIDSIYDPQATNSDGLYFKFEPGEGLIFASMKGAATQFYDGSNNLIPKRTQWNYYDANVLINEGTTKIVNTTLIFDVDGSGNLVVRKKALGADGTGDIIIQVKNGAMRQFNPETYPYVGMCYSEASGAIANSVISEFKISTVDGGNETVFNQFTEDKVSEWQMYKAGTTKTSFFGFEASLHLGEDGKGGNFSATKPLVLAKNLFLNEAGDAFDSFVEMQLNVKVGELAANSKFGVVTGFEKRSNASLGNAKTTYVYFTKGTDGVSINADTYHEQGTATSLFAGDTFDVNAEGFAELYIKVDYKGKLTVSVGGTVIYQSSAENEVYAANLMGFALSGDNAGLDVDIAKFNLYNRHYTRPENTDINLTFDDNPETADVDESNSYNRNEWNLMYQPYMAMHTNSAYVKDGKLMFDNCAYGTGFVTQKQYSNFELQMDIDDIRRDVVKDAAGNKNYPVSALIGYYWGVTSSSHPVSLGGGAEYPFVYIEAPVDINTWDREQRNGADVPMTLRATGNGMNMSWELSDHYDFWANKNEGKVLQFKIKVENENVKFFFRYVGEEEWCNVDRNGQPLSIDMKSTLTGNVGITTMGCSYYVPVISEGASCGYFSADNIIVKNTDDTPSLVDDLVYSTSKIEYPTDFDYVDNTNSDAYKPQAKTEGAGCKSSVGNAGGGIVAVIAACAGLCIIKVRRKNHE